MHTCVQLTLKLNVLLSFLCFFIPFFYLFVFLLPFLLSSNIICFTSPLIFHIFQLPQFFFLPLLSLIFINLTLPFPFNFFFLMFHYPKSSQTSPNPIKSNSSYNEICPHHVRVRCMYGVLLHPIPLVCLILRELCRLDSWN